MPVSNGNAQIINLSKSGFSAEEIAQVLGYEPEAVAVVLAQAGPRALITTEEEQLPDDTEGEKYAEMRLKKLQKLAFDGLEHLMLNSEDENIRMKIYMYVSDQRLGLKRPAKAAQTVNNILVMNEEIKKVKEMTRLAIAV